VEKREGKRSLEKPGNINMNLKDEESYNVNSIHLAQDTA
jgi:hypothetical protein